MLVLIVEVVRVLIQFLALSLALAAVAVEKMETMDFQVVRAVVAVILHRAHLEQPIREGRAVTVLMSVAAAAVVVPLLLVPMQAAELAVMAVMEHLHR